jgi:hypothetical protein
MENLFRPLILRNILNINENSMKRFSIASILFAVVTCMSLFGTPNSEARKFSLYNLSILLPLPRQSFEELPGLDATGCSHVFLDKELFADLPNLLQVPNSLEEQYRINRLVGLRFDLKSEELRLIFQPLYKRSPESRPEADDAALHLFLRMPKSQMLQAQRTLADAYPNLPLNRLGIHPSLKTVSSSNPLKQLICQASELELFKVTFMNVRRGRMIWNFGGFHVASDSRGIRTRGPDVEISNAQGVFLDEGDSDMSVQRVARFSGSVTANLLPRVAGGDDMTKLFEIRGQVPVSEVATIRESVDRIEHPGLNNPSTVDCVSCHATESARVLLEDQFHSRAGREAYVLPAGYSLDTSVERDTLRNTANFRAFGYLDSLATINRRVLNDTVEMQLAADIFDVLAVDSAQ